MRKSEIYDDKNFKLIPYSYAGDARNSPKKSVKETAYPKVYNTGK